MAAYHNIKDKKNFDECVEYEYSDSLSFDFIDVDDIHLVGGYLSDVDDDSYCEHHSGARYFLDTRCENEIPEDYTMILYRKEKSDVDVWNEILLEVRKDAYLGEIALLQEMLKFSSENGLDDCSVIISKIVSTISNYKDSLNVGVDFSKMALLQLVRYVPFLSYKKNVEFYLDKNTGYIGVIIPMKKNKKGTINITIMDTHEVYYSYVRKKTGLVKFSGKGYLGEDLNNSDAIMSILKMSDW